MGWENWGISTFSLLQNSDVGTKEAFLVQLHRHNCDRGGGYLVEC